MALSADNFLSFIFFLSKIKFLFKTEKTRNIEEGKREREAELVLARDLGGKKHARAQLY